MTVHAMFDGWSMEIGFGGVDAMMALIGLVLFTSALGAVAGVVWFTLLPAMPRMTSLLRDSLARDPLMLGAPVALQTARIVARDGAFAARQLRSAD